MAIVKFNYLTDIIILVCYSLSLSASTVCGTEGRRFDSCRVRQQLQRFTTFYILKITKLRHFCAISISERTGMTVSQVTDEVLYTGLVEMQEL